MENLRSARINSYFALVRKLNSGNFAENESTKTIFFVKEVYHERWLFIGLKSHSQRILLCRREKGNSWKEGEATEHEELELFIAKLLNKQKELPENLTNYIKSHLFEFSDELI